MGRGLLQRQAGEQVDCLRRTPTAIILVLNRAPKLGHETKEGSAAPEHRRVLGSPDLAVYDRGC